MTLPEPTPRLTSPIAARAPGAFSEFHADDFDAARLAQRKGSLTVSLCLPAHNEAETIGDIVRSIRRNLIHDVPLVDEMIVIDDASTDRTAEIAAAAGATVLDSAQVLVEQGSRRGKGEALWKSVAAARGDLLVWIDADLTSFVPSFVTGLLGPLIADPSVMLVKGFYERPGGADETGGGRVTELVARPLLATWFLELTGIHQPLGGEYAARRTVLERVPFAGGYGVDIGLLIDIANGWGVETIAQVDLGVRGHRNRPLSELGPQAMAVLTTTLRRAGVDVPPQALLPVPGKASHLVDVADRPPLVEIEIAVSRGAPRHASGR